MPTTYVEFHDVHPFPELAYTMSYRVEVHYPAGKPLHWDAGSIEIAGADMGTWVDMGRQHPATMVAHHHLAGPAYRDNCEAIERQLQAETESEPR